LLPADGPTSWIDVVASEARGARPDPGDAVLVLKGPQRINEEPVDPQLAFPLIVRVAQQRRSAVHKIPDANLKSLAIL